MTRQWLILTAGAVSLGLAACGDYEQNQAYNEAGNAYDEAGNAAYGENEAYDANAAYPPIDNAITNEVGNGVDDAGNTAENVTTNNY